MQNKHKLMIPYTEQRLKLTANLTDQEALFRNILKPTTHLGYFPNYNPLRTNDEKTPVNRAKITCLFSLQSRFQRVKNNKVL